MAYINAYGGGGIPAALKTRMNAVLNKKFETSTSYLPAHWPNQVNLLGKLAEKTAIGEPIAAFSDGADDVPIKSGIFNIDYTGTAVNKIRIRNTGKNLLDDTKKAVYAAGVLYCFSLESNTGTVIDYLPAGTYTFKPYLVAGVNLRGVIIATTNPNSQIVNDFTSPSSVTFTINEPKKNIYIMMYRETGSWSLSDVIGAQLEIGLTPSDYEEFKVGYDVSVPLQCSIPIYGGWFDCVLGLGKATKAADGSDLPSERGIAGASVLINTFEGNNVIYGDLGGCEIVYRSFDTIVTPTLISKTITENGTYNAADDDADGYSDVTVNVPQNTPLIPQFTETKIADNTAHASSFTLTEDYGNFDMVKIVWFESSTSSGFLYTTPDILDEIFSIGVGKLCINKPSTNVYICYSKNGLTWTQTNQRVLFVHEIYGVTFTNCTMQTTDLYKRGASTTNKYPVTSQTSLKEYDLFMMASIHATDGSETMPTTWLYQYPKENMSDAFSCPVPTVLQEYNGNDEAFVISEYEMSAARFFMVQGIKFTPVSSSRGLMMASRPVTQLVGEESDPDQVNELVEDDENDISVQLNEVVENDETEQEGENDA